MNSTEIAAQVAQSLNADVDGRDIILTNSNDAMRARFRAVELGAVETTVRPSALFGSYVVTVWQD